MPLLSIAQRRLDETFDTLIKCGQGGRECVVYWTGSFLEEREVDDVVHPVHRGTKLGYTVDDGWLTRFMWELRAEGRTARAQVHTHPGTAFHSMTDDGFPLIPAEGFLSIVIPRFALGPRRLDEAALYRLGRSAEWEGRDTAEIEVRVDD